MSLSYATESIRTGPKKSALCKKGPKIVWILKNDNSSGPNKSRLNSQVFYLIY